MEKLEGTIHGLCQRGKRSPIRYLNLLQAFHDEPKVFLSLLEQLQGFKNYNEWLRKVYPSHVIPEVEMQTMEDKILNLDPEALLFYWHGDVVLTSKLAWEYICSYRQKTRKSNDVVFEPKRMRLNIREPSRPKGFYWGKRPKEDKKAIGKKFQGRKATDVRMELGNDIGMASEGIQFVGITHKHYQELMNGEEYPFIDLPGFDLDFGVDGASSFIASLDLDSKGTLNLYCGHVVTENSLYGSGSLLPV